MNISELIEQTRKIVKTHYQGMKRMEMEDSDPEITKADLCQQLSSFVPGMQPDLLQPLYTALDEKGYATLITNDTITFSKSFIGED